MKKKYINMRNTKAEFKKIQDKLDKQPQLCFGKTCKKITEDNYKDFIVSFLTTYRIKRKTYEIDPETGKRYVFCDTYRTRSLTDLYKVTKFYFPDVTLEQVKKEMLQLEKDKKLSGSWCHTVNRQVYTYMSTPNKYNNVHRNPKKKDETGLWI